MITSITLDNLLPEVFAAANKNVDSSEIWLREVTFEKGKRYLIEAESGTGKTSLCAYLMGMRTDFRGKILFDGEDSAQFGARQWADIRKQALAWLPQEMGLFENLTLLENIDIKNRLTNYLTANEILGYVEQLGLSDKINVKAKRLSIGQQQRVAFIRMLCQPADFFLLDEPVSHLDTGNNAILADIMTQRLEKTGAGLIATSVGNRIAIDNLKELTL